MKKNLIILVLCLLSFGKANSQISDLVVDAGSMFPSSYSGVYAYKGYFNKHPYWVGPKSVNTMAISFNSMYNRYIYSNFSNDTNSLMWANAYDNSSSTSTIPTTGWNMIKVMINGPTVKYQSVMFKEITANDGSFTEQISVSHNKMKGYYFSGNTGDDFVSTGKVNISNLSAGLTAKLVKQNDSTLTLSLSGKANNHSIDTSFVVDFTNSAFGGGGTIDSTYGVSTTIKINFINVYTVGATGADYNTVKAGMLAVKTDDILKIFEGTYTEDSIVNASGVTSIIIMGAGPAKTIIQGATQPFAGGKNGVFRISAGDAHFYDLTIQNGDVMGNNGGGAINSYGKVYLHNCRILNNRAFGKTNNYAAGGGVFTQNLYVYNSEISGNIADNEQKTGQVNGGGVYASLEIYMENTTVSGNFSRADGGGILAGNNMSKFVNTTITNNTSGVKGGGVCTYGKNIYVNSIVWGNSCPNGKDIHEINGHVYPIFITKSFIGDVTAVQGKTPLIEGAYYNVDPKLDTLKFNCSDTRTHALLSGSTALDSGVYADSIPALDQRGFPILGTKDIGAQESVNQLIFSLAKDTTCLEAKEQFVLKGSPENGVFSGEGVTGNVLDISKITKSGFVVVTYSYNATGCVDLLTKDSIYVAVCTPSSVQDLNLPLSVYPNPVKSQLTLNAFTNSSMIVNVTNVAGVVVFEKEFNASKATLDMQNLPSGVYFLSVKSEGKVAHQKVIKQ